MTAERAPARSALAVGERGRKGCGPKLAIHDRLASIVGARTGVEPSAFGSLLWQYQTGLTYLSPHSDLDILWPVPSAFDVLSLVFSIAEVQRAAPLRIDGEVVFPDGSAVNCRELWMAHRAADRGSVLVKTMEGGRLLESKSPLGIGQHS